MNLRPELGTLPLRLRQLPIDARGYPVPWFVDWIDGKPEFRAMDPQKFARAIRERRCWVCGDVLGKHLAFVIGPMCAINRTSAEPPCHHECAVWSAQHCPFLSRPHMIRRENDLPAEAVKGEASIERNPGCAGIWTTKTYRVFKAPGASAIGYLVEMGEPEKVEWFAEGRPATREEVLRSIDSGLPLLEAQCGRERPSDRAMALAALRDARAAVERLLPAHTGVEAIIHGGEYHEYSGKGLKKATPGDPDVVLCRRVVDYPDGCAPEGAALGTCAICDSPVAFNPQGPHQDRPRVCLQCGGIEPLPVPRGTSQKF